MDRSALLTPNQALQATAAKRGRFTLSFSHSAVVADASASPAAVPELGRSTKAMKVFALHLVLVLLLSGCAGAVDGDPTVNLARLRHSTESKERVYWVECHYPNWTALACWSPSDTQQETLIQVYVVAASSEWHLLSEERIPFPKDDQDRIERLEPVATDRLFMVIDRRGLLMHSIFGYDQDKESNQRVEQNRRPAWQFLTGTGNSNTGRVYASTLPAAVAHPYR